MRRVCVAITARPSYSRVQTVLEALRDRSDVELQIVACASALMTRYGRVADQIEADGFEITDRLPSVIEDDTVANSARSTGLLLTQMAGTLERLRPDVVVTIADRHETLATAIAASYQHIPLAHIQGGEISGSIDNKVRWAVTQLADLHLVATERAAERLRVLYKTSPIIVTGCPGIDLARRAKELGPIHRADVVVLQHPVTDQADQAGEQMRATIDAIGRDALYFWPGEDAGGAAMSKELRLAGIQPVRSLPPLEFLRVLLGAKLLVGNSSVGIRECSYLGVPVANIGDRQRHRERASNVLDLQPPFSHSGFVSRPKPSTLYGDGHAGERIAAILAGKAEEVAA